VSACLLGESVRYNAGHKLCGHPVLRRWIAEGRVVSVCPEVEGGLPVPRPAAEIASAGGGAGVLLGYAKVIDASGHNVSVHFVQGAEQALAHANNWNIRIAVLKEGSPSCGSGFIYDGSFSAKRVAGSGVTASLLRQHGICVFSEEELEKADNLMLSVEGAGGK
jgi:uncharacterized protein YbbK (DUF523 family)